MPIAANQKVNEGFDYRVNQVEVPHPVTGDKSGYFMNVREDNDEILGWTTDRYGLIQNSDLLDRADQAFSDRGINVERNVIITEDGAKMRGRFLVQRLDYSGDFNGERTYSMQLESSGAVVPS